MSWQAVMNIGRESSILPRNFKAGNFLKHLILTIAKIKVNLKKSVLHSLKGLKALG
jgi:hypothetical protein